MKIVLKKEVLIILSFIILLVIYINSIFSPSIARGIFAKQVTQVWEENKDPVFKLDKIMLYSSADVIDNSQGETMQDINIQQYTDVAIYIKGRQEGEELTQKNTIKELYIDQIAIQKEGSIGEGILNYKNPKDFGRFRSLENPENSRIDFKITYTNEQDKAEDYNNPVFYTDASNPISLGFVNKDILTNGVVSGGDGTISFNGNILKIAGIELKDIQTKISFKIHIRNNVNEEYCYEISIPLITEELDKKIYEGYVSRTIKPYEKTDAFFKIPNT